MTQQPQPLYKVLRDGQSIHGDLTWSLPTQQPDGTWVPGDWHEVSGRIVVCSRGLHLTTDPQRWMQSGATVYLAEGAGASDAEGDKIAFARARLLRPLTDDELAALRIFVSGAHQVSDGAAWASGSATVRASDSATVEAYGSATVRAWNSAVVTLTRWFTGAAPVLSDDAVCIDRRVSPPRISVGGVAYVPEVRS